MAKKDRPERPKSRLPDGRVNPAYTKWRKENIAAAADKAFPPPPGYGKAFAISEGRPETPLDKFIQGDGKEPVGVLTDEIAAKAIQDFKPDRWATMRRADGSTERVQIMAETGDVVSTDFGTFIGGVYVLDPECKLITEPETLTLRVVKLARNAKFVYCDLNGVKVSVRVKKGLQNRLLKKHIQVRKEGETYVHIR